MNKFELFCMIYYVLDADWDDSKNKELGEFLSSANPFLFDDVGSADSSVYTHFCDVITDVITIENSYALAKLYIDSLDNDVISAAFTTINEEEWIESVKDYLSSDHRKE